MMVKIELQFTSVAEAAAFLAAGNGAPAVVTTAVTAAGAPKPGKEARTPKPDAKPQEEPAASGAQTATDSPAASAASAASAPAERPKPVLTYEKSGIGEKITSYVGSKDVAGYADRRKNIVDLLAEFKVANGKLLAPEQFDPFLAKLDALTGASDSSDWHHRV